MTALKSATPTIKKQTQKHTDSLSPSTSNFVLENCTFSRGGKLRSSGGVLLQEWDRLFSKPTVPSLPALNAVKIWLSFAYVGICTSQVELRRSAIQVVVSFVIIYDPTHKPTSTLVFMIFSRSLSVSHCFFSLKVCSIVISISSI